MAGTQFKYRGSFSELPADTLLIDVEETGSRVGWFAARLRNDDGNPESPAEALCESSSPFTESALILLERGYDPERTIAMVHNGREFYAMCGKLGAAAEVARARKRDGGRS